MIAITNIEFLEAMFPDLDDDAAAMLCGFVGDPGKPPEYAWAAKPWAHGQELPWCVKPRSNNYVAISSFTTDAEGRYRRRVSQFRRLHAVMIDDVGTKVELHRLRLDASAVVETSPNNFQHFLFVADSPAARCVDVSTRLIDRLIGSGLMAGGIDPGMAGVNRWSRLPVGVNGKGKYVEQLGRSFPCRLTRWAPDRRYTVETIAEAFKLDLTPPPEVKRPMPSITARKGRAEDFALLMQVVHEAGLYFETLEDADCGRKHLIRCPWVHTHTDRVDTGSAVIEPNEKNRFVGGYKCWHGHCRDVRGIGDLYGWMRVRLEREVA